MRIPKRLLIALALVLLAGTLTGSADTATPLKALVLSAPLRFDYVPSGAGNKPILTSDLDGAYIKSVTRSDQTITFNLQAASNQAQTLDITLEDTGAALPAPTYSADTETLTLALSQGGPITADPSGVTAATELSTAIQTAATEINAATTQQIHTAIAAKTDAVVFAGTYAANTQTLTLDSTEGDDVAVDLSAVTADADGVLTAATYSADTETLTMTLSAGGPVTADLSGLTTTAEVTTAIRTALSAETDSALTAATYAA